MRKTPYGSTAIGAAAAPVPRPAVHGCGARGEGARRAELHAHARVRTVDLAVHVPAAVARRAARETHCINSRPARRRLAFKVIWTYTDMRAQRAVFDEA